MRNLKKVLSLSLAFVMLLGMMVVGGSAATADFSDAAEIENSTAVNALYTLGVINGRDDGSFDPTGSVTRAEMAKMICVLHNGGKDPLIGSDATATFTDTVGHWAAPYIAYATNIEVIAGLGNNTFAPNDTVTGAQAAKMLLVTLGYDPDVFGLVGSDWALNAAVIANQIDLFDGIEDITLSQPLNREDAAQMIFNALNAHIMVKTYDKVLSTGEISYNYSLNEGKTLLNDTYGAIKVEGYVTGNEYADLADAVACLAAGKTTVVVTNGDEINTSDLACYDGIEYTFNTSTGYDELGKNVILYVKPSQASTAAVKATVIGGAIISDNDITEKDTAWQPFMLPYFETDAKVYVNGVLQFNDANTNGIWDAGESLDAYGDNGENTTGYKTQFIDLDFNGYVDLVLVDKRDLGKVVTYSNAAPAGKISVLGDSATGTLTYQDKYVVGFENVAKGDYVIYSEVGGRLYVEKAETVTGTMTDYNSQVTVNGVAAKTIWVDGNAYTVSGITGLSTLGTVAGDTSALNGLEAIFYLDGCGYAAFYDGAVPNYYALATYANSASHAEGSIVTAPRAQTYFEDGTTSAPVYDLTTGDYSAFTTLEGSNENFAANAFLFQYTYNLAGQLQVNEADAVTASTGTFKYTSGNVLVSYNGSWLDDNGDTAGGDKAYMTDETVVYLVETVNNLTTINDKQVGKVRTIVGKDNVPSFELGTGYVVKYFVNGDNEIEAMAVIAPEIDGTTTQFLYAIEVVSTALNTKQVKVAIGDEVSTITVNHPTRLGALAVNTTYTYQIDENGNYTLAPAGNINVDYDNIEFVNTNLYTVGVNNDEYAVTKDTVFVNVGSKETWSFEELNRGDIISIVADRDNNLLAVYVHETVTNSAPMYKTPTADAKNGGLYNDSGAYKLKFTTGIAGTYTFAYCGLDGAETTTSTATSADGRNNYVTFSFGSLTSGATYYYTVADASGDVVASGCFVAD